MKSKSLDVIMAHSRKALVLFGMVWAGLILPSIPVGAQLLSEQFDKVVMAAARLNQNSLVQIELIGVNATGSQAGGATGPFSGTVVGSDGLIVTSGNFFAKPFAGISIRLAEGERLPAKLIARDHSRNLALLKVESPPANWVAVQSGPIGELHVGQTVIALGRSIDARNNSISTGVLSAVNRLGERALQIDAIVGLQNYGGLVVDLEGRPLGVLVPLTLDSGDPESGMDWYDSGVGFAIPIESALRSIEKLRLGTDQHSGQLGIGFEPTASIFSPPRILSVHPGSPAANAGLLRGDLIVKLNGRTPSRIGQVHDWLRPLYAGEAVEIIVTRDGRSMTFLAPLVSELPAYSQPLIGIIPDDREKSAAKILACWENGAGFQAGMRSGDWIRVIDGDPIEQADRIREILATKLPGDSIKVELTDRSGSDRALQFELGAMNADTWPAPPFQPAPKITARPITHSEFKNKATLVACDSRESIRALLIWLPEAGAYSVDHWATSLGNSWPNDLALLAIESTDSQKWQNDDFEVILEFLSLAKRDLNAESLQVAIGGHKTGSAMAAMTAARSPQVFRGLALRECSSIPDLERLKPQPGLSLLVWLNRTSTPSDSSTNPGAPLASTDFIKVPLHVDLKSYQSDVEFIQTIAPWLLQLDRF